MWPSEEFENAEPELQFYSGTVTAVSNKGTAPTQGPRASVSIDLRGRLTH